MFCSEVKNIPNSLGLHQIECVAHSLAQSVGLQLFGDKNENKLGISAGAVPAILEHHDRVRVKVREFWSNERLRAALADAIETIVKCPVECPVQPPILDCSTKWSSIIDMDESDWALRKAYAEVLRKNSNISALSWKESDYLLSRNCAGILRPFQHALNLLQQDGESVSIVLPVIAALSKQLESSVEIEVSGSTQGTTETISEGQLDEHSRSLRQKLRSEVDRHRDHLEKWNFVFEIATSVDPRYRSLAFLTQEHVQRAHKRLMDTVFEHAQTNPVVNSPDDICNSNNQKSRKRSLVGMDGFLSAMSKIRENIQEEQDQVENPLDQHKTLKRVCKAEVNAWFAKDQIDIHSDSIVWWQQNQKSFPHIAPIARKYLAIPSSSFGIQRMFSSCKELLEESWHSESPERKINLFMNMETLGIC